MIEKIINWCWNHSKATILASLMLAAWGIYCLQMIKVDAIPDLSET